jgi:hypothetical protein
MDLVETDESPSSKHQDAQSERVLTAEPPPNTQFFTVEKRTLSPRTNAWARVAVDATNEFVVTAPADGWIRQVYVNHIGQTVTAGESLFEIFSPELYQRQRDYIDTLNRRDQLADSITDMRGQNAEVLGSLARERKRQRDAFLRIGIASISIDTLEQYRRPLDTLAIASPYAGTVTAVDARSGLTAGPSTALYRIVNNQNMPVDVVLTPAQMKTVQTPARLAIAGGDAENTVSIDLSQAGYDSTLQSYVVRTLLPKDRLNKTPWAGLMQHAVPVGAVLDVSVLSAAQEALVVPRQAILESPDGQFLVVEVEPSRYAVRKVVAGASDTHWTAIREGVQAGDKVVTEGQFLLDAAATFQQSFSQSHTD